MGPENMVKFEIVLHYIRLVLRGRLNHYLLHLLSPHKVIGVVIFPLALKICL